MLVEDDARVGDFLQRGLTAEGHVLRWARSGGEGEAMARAWYPQTRELQQPSVMLLDLMLPDMDGLALCQTLRAGGVQWPILVLSALGELQDRLAGLRMGADDYLVKPFAFEELLARIEALARRSRDQRVGAARHLQVADLCFDREQMRVRRGATEIKLTAKELALLELFMTHPGRVFSRERILAQVWGAHQDPLTNVVDVYIRRLRAKVDEGFEPALIQTLRGLGYRMQQDAALSS